MKITEKKSIVPFDEIRPGDVFRFKDCIYMKILPVLDSYNDIETPFNSVSLYNGDLNYFLEEDNVESLPTAELIIH